MVLQRACCGPIALLLRTLLCNAVISSVIAGSHHLPAPARARPYALRAAPCPQGNVVLIWV